MHFNRLLVLGDLIQEECVATIADDLCVGGNTPGEVLPQLDPSASCIKAQQPVSLSTTTIACPTSTAILGWIWCNGTQRARPRKIATLCAVDPPVTAQRLRSFVDAYKVLSRILPGYVDLLVPLDQATAGR